MFVEVKLLVVTLLNYYSPKENDLSLTRCMKIYKRQATIRKKLKIPEGHFINYHY